jgi:hypothetical protein
VVTVAGLFQNPHVEAQPGQLAIEKALGLSRPIAAWQASSGKSKIRLGPSFGKMESRG